MAKLEMESWEDLIAAEIAKFEEMDGAEITLEELILLADLDDLSEEVHCSEDLGHDRWELDPASAEDSRNGTKGGDIRR